MPINVKSIQYSYHSSHDRKNVRRDIMKTVNLQVRINEDLKQEVSSILKAQGLSYTSMLDALFRQIIKERRIPFASTYGASPSNEIDIAFDSIDKTGVLNIRINPKVKTLTTAILKEMGLTISQTITLVSKQIQFAKNIPPTIHRPKWVDAINNNLWTEEALNARVQTGLNQAKNGIGEPAEKVFNELLKDL